MYFRYDIILLAPEPSLWTYLISLRAWIALDTGCLKSCEVSVNFPNVFVDFLLSNYSEELAKMFDHQTLL